MAKYHIGSNGKPTVCRARARACPIGGDEVHGDTITEIEQKIAAINTGKLLASSRKKGVVVTGKPVEPETSVDNEPQSRKPRARKTPQKKKDMFQPTGVVETGEGLYAGWTGKRLLELREENGGHTPSDDVLRKHIKKDINTAVKTGFLPSVINGHEVTYKVTKGHGDVTVSITPKEKQLIIDPPALGTSSRGYHEKKIVFGDPTTASEVDEAKKKCTDIINQYNHNHSNSMVDYFDRGLHDSVVSTVGESSLDASATHRMKLNLARDAMEQIDAMGGKYDMRDPAQVRQALDELYQTSPEFREKAVRWVTHENADTVNRLLKNRGYELSDHAFTGVHQQKITLSEYDERMDTNLKHMEMEYEKAMDTSTSIAHHNMSRAKTFSDLSIVAVSSYTRRLTLGNLAEVASDTSTEYVPHGVLYAQRRDQDSFTDAVVSAYERKMKKSRRAATRR